MARSRRLRRLASGVTLLGAAVSTIVGRTPPDGTTTTTTPASVFPTWIAGDSISRGAALAMDTSVNIVGMAGAAFVSTARSATTISQDIGAAILGSGSMPERVVIVGGVNDRDEVPAVVTDSMTTLEADLESVGVDVVWVTEPAKQFASDVAPLNAWILTRPGSLDCAPVVASSIFESDGLHPNEAGYAAFAACIDAGLIGGGSS